MSRSIRLLLAATVVAAAALVPLAARPAQQVTASIETASTINGLFQTYLTGNRAEAISTLAAWPEGRVATEADKFGNNFDPWQGFALAMFHTEAGLANLTFAADAGNRPLGSGQLEPHAARALSLISSLIDDRQTPADVLTACQSWIVFASAFRKHTQNHAEPFSNLLVNARPPLSTDAAMQLLQGSLIESRTGHLPMESHMAIGADDGDVFISTPHGMFNETRARRAEREFRSAIANRPALLEATLRLGRLTSLVGRPKDAEKLLEQVSTSSTSDRWMSGLADLFLADLHAFEGRSDSAADDYRRAITRDPALGPAYIGLSYLELEQGHEDNSAAVLNAGLGAQRAFGTLWNPLATYESAQFHAANEQLVTLRQIVSSHFGTSPTPPPAFAYLTPPPSLTAAVSSTLTPLPQPVRSGTGQFFSQSEGVRLVVRVTAAGKPVGGLSAKDFTVTDQGVAQAVASVSAPGGLQIVAATDISHPSTSEMLRAGRPASLAASIMRNDDRMTVVNISDSVLTAASNVPASQRLTDLLARPTPDRFGMTALWDGIYAAISLAKSRERIPYVLVSGTQCITGGGDNASWLTLNQVASAARRSGVVVDAVWHTRTLEQARPDRGYYREMDIVYGNGHADDVVAAAGGMTFSGDDPELATKLRRRLDDLRQSYIVTYIPRNVAPDGWHDVRVQSSTGKAVTRSGYGPAKK